MAERLISRFKYSTSAVDRIHQMEADTIVKFFGEISQQAATRAIALLPNLPGFRPNSKPGVHRQISLLAKRLTGDKSWGPENIQLDLDVLGDAWKEWGIKYLGNESIINNYINRSQAQDQVETCDEKTNDDDPLAVELFEKLRDLSRANGCGREAIKKFFEFSPLGETERLRSIIESCKTTAEITFDKNISTLLHKVEGAEQKITDLLKTVDALSKDDKTHTDNFSALRRDIEKLQKAISDSSGTESRIRKGLEVLLSEVASLKKQAAEEAMAREKLTQTVDASIKKLRSDLAAIRDQVNPLAERSTKASKAVININAELNQMRELIAEVRTIVNRVSTTERPIDDESNSAIREVGSGRIVALEKLGEMDRSEKPAALRGREEFISAVTTNLEALNIKKSSAEALALECIAALMAGQMPYFAGLSSKRVAEACAIALAANDTYVLTVPVGISAPNEFRRQLMGYLFAKERQDVGCVIIEGINRSAFDTFGESLIEMISRQRSGHSASRSLLVMATLTDGPASLPLSVAHVSLGPVFYTDALDWRARPRIEVQRADGRISAQIWKGACGALERATPGSEEALRLLNEFAPTANPLLRGTVLSGFHALSALRNERNGPTALQSLAFGWLTPVCIAVGSTAEDVDQEFDQGIVDGETPDTRLANLLHSGTFDSRQKRGGI